MRILFVIHSWHPEGRGGTELHAHAVARTLAARGHQVGVFARTGHPDRPHYEITTEWQGPISVTRVNNCFWDSPTLDWIYKNETIHAAFEREVESFAPDLVHIHHLTGLSTTIVEHLKRRRIPVVQTLHDFWNFCPRGQRMTPQLRVCEDIDRRQCATCLGQMWPHLFGDDDPLIVDIRGRLSPTKLAEWDRHMVYVLRLVDLLITPSEFHRERTLDHPIDADRIVSLPHGMDHAPFAGIRRDPTFPPKRIGYIGSVIPPKGAHLLLEAYKALGPREGLSLHIHGGIPPFHEDKTYGERLRAQAAERDDIHFHGEYEPGDVPAILESLDLLVVPSLWWETFCLTLREGLLAGIPVIASGHGAMREALDGEENGILFRPGDVKDLTTKIARVLDDDDYRARYMNRGRSVKTIESYVEELEALYRRTVEISEARSGTLTIAPSSFPAPGIERGEIPWGEVGVSLSQKGRLSVSMHTVKPSPGSPKVTVDLSVNDGIHSLGTLGVEIDLQALAGHLAAAPAESDDKAKPRAKTKKRTLARTGAGLGLDAPSSSQMIPAPLRGSQRTLDMMRAVGGKARVPVGRKTRVKRLRFDKD